ncbi:MAG: PEP-CTERM sorting domain-containing protein [Rhodospirillales bacterium]
MTYTVSGSSGDWTLDFSVTNNMTGFPGQGIYYFIVQPNDAITGSPAGGWVDAGNAPYSFAGAADATYNTAWIASGVFVNGGPPDEAIFPGRTLSGFEVLDTSAKAPTSIDWVLFSSAQSVYDGGGNFYNNDSGTNPGFEGTATSLVPEPSTLAILGIGLSGLLVLARGRRAA